MTPDKPSPVFTDRDAMLKAEFARIDAAFARATAGVKRSWVPDGLWLGLADSMDAAKDGDGDQ